VSFFFASVTARADSEVAPPEARRSFCYRRLPVGIGRMDPFRAGGRMEGSTSLCAAHSSDRGHAFFSPGPTPRFVAVEQWRPLRD
jgi:hypothetical protein